MILTILLALAVAGAVPAHAAEQPGVDVDAARSRVEARYEIVALKGGIGLRPKDRNSKAKMIDVSDGTIAIDGTVVSGRELRDRVGNDAELIIPLSYYDAEQRRVFLRQPAPPEAPERPERPEAPERPEPPRHRSGERVRVFGSVTVAADEDIDGQVVAVMGSARINGRVRDQVVAVLGSVTLGSDAVVDGDVIAVGGRVNQADGARVRGAVREVSLRSPGIEWGGVPFAMSPLTFYSFGATARLFGTMFRLLLLGILTSVVVLVVRQPIEQVGQRLVAEPVKMAVIGLLAQLLFFPALILTIFILAISLIGIPLLLLTPFLIVGLLFVFLGGFTAAAFEIGGWGAQRAGINADQPYVRVWFGVLIVLAPLLVARLFGMVGGPFGVGAFMLAAIALLIEYAVWTTGFGAALSTAFGHWRNRRAMVPPTV